MPHIVERQLQPLAVRVIETGNRAELLRRQTAPAKRLSEHRIVAVADQSCAAAAENFSRGVRYRESHMPAEQKDKARLGIADSNERRSGRRRMLGNERGGAAAKPQPLETGQHSCFRGEEEGRAQGDDRGGGAGRARAVAKK